MIQAVWPYLAVILLAAGLFPSLERSYRWRIFSVLPPIVLTYLLVTALAVAGLWEAGEEIKSTQRLLIGQLLPALLFLLMVTCDLRAILALGPRVLAIFLCAMTSILAAIVLTYLAFRTVLPPDGWKMLAALSATWVGGSANLLAVKQAIGLADSSLPSVLLADALCYSVWVVFLFSSGALAPAFNRWTRADTRPHPEMAAPISQGSAEPGTVLLWLGLALVVGLCAAIGAGLMPVTTFFTATTWTVLIASVVGLIVARTPLARIPGPNPLASALLAVLVAVLASQSNFRGMAAAPLFVLCGFCVLLVHIVLLALAARVFRFDLQLCGIASLAQIGGVASAPLLAATYAQALVPVAVLLAMLGLILGTGIGLFMASVLSALAPVAG
jgi:uncharacterized membrane protein